MEIELEPGTYVLAVSGGVDSMVLLDLLHNKSGVKLVVAHYDHGIRDDSHQDRLLVQQTAARHGLGFVYDEGHLGADASEATAREARYQFLERVQRASNAAAIITAHHKDDLVETAVINLLRGTGRKGLTSLYGQPNRLRPLLSVTKASLVQYATANGLRWREDSTNSNPDYLRNHIRQNLLPRLGSENAAKLHDIVLRQQAINQELDSLLMAQLQLQPAIDQLDRQWFTLLPHAVAREVLATWLRLRGVRSFDRKTLERVVVLCKVARAGAHIAIKKGYGIDIREDSLTLKSPI